MNTLGRALWSVIATAIVGALVVAGLNRVLGEGWYHDLPGGNGVDRADPTGGGGQGGGGSKCRRPSAETTGKLPKFGDGYKATINPCLSFVDVLAELNDMVPERGESVPGSEANNGSADKVRVQREKFHRGVAAARKRIGMLVTAKDAVQCGYATDHLAIGLYQAKSPKWSAGVVVVLKGDIDAVTETAVCTLLRQIPGLGDGESDEQPSPRVSFCFDHRRTGEYTMMWLGSSDVVCSLFAEKLGGSAAAHPDWPMVWADPLTKRDGPHLNAQEKGKLPFGTAVDVDCQRTDGDKVTGLSGQPDPRWVKLRDGTYVARAWLIRRDRQELSIDDCPSAG